MLSWRPGPLGPQPASRLPGDLTPQVAGALQTVVRTDAAAATALSVHLNQGPAFFGVLQLGDVAPDGSAIRVPASRARPVRRGITPGADGVYGQMLEADERSWRELAAAEPIRIPDVPGPCSPRTWPTGATAAPPAPTPTSRTPRPWPGPGRWRSGPRRR